MKTINLFSYLFDVAPLIERRVDITANCTAYSTTTDGTEGIVRQFHGQYLRELDEIDRRIELCKLDHSQM